MKKFISALIIVFLLLLIINPSTAHAQVINDFLIAHGLSSDTTKEEYLDYLIENAKYKPWEQELGVDATIDDIGCYLFDNYILPEELGLSVDEEYADWYVGFYVPYPEKSLTQPRDYSIVGKINELISIKLIDKLISLVQPIFQIPVIIDSLYGVEGVVAAEVDPAYSTIPWTIGPNLQGEMKDGTYTGELKDSIPHGQGKWTSPAGESYDGEWENGDFNGYGTWTGTDDHYVGEWKDNLLHGKGIYTHEGHVWDATFKEGVFQEGTHTNPEGEVFYFDLTE